MIEEPNVGTLVKLPAIRLIVADAANVRLLPLLKDPDVNVNVLEAGMVMAEFNVTLVGLLMFTLMFPVNPVVENV